MSEMSTGKIKLYAKSIMDTSSDQDIVLSDPLDMYAYSALKWGFKQGPYSLAYVECGELYYWVEEVPDTPQTSDAWSATCTTPHPRVVTAHVPFSRDPSNRKFVAAKFDMKRMPFTWFWMTEIRPRGDTYYMDQEGKFLQEPFTMVIDTAGYDTFLLSEDVPDLKRGPRYWSALESPAAAQKCEDVPPLSLVFGFAGQYTSFNGALYEGKFLINDSTGKGELEGKGNLLHNLKGKGKEKVDTTLFISVPLRFVVVHEVKPITGLLSGISGVLGLGHRRLSTSRHATGNLLDQLGTMKASEYVHFEKKVIGLKLRPAAEDKSYLTLGYVDKEFPNEKHFRKFSVPPDTNHWAVPWLGIELTGKLNVKAMFSSPRYAFLDSGSRDMFLGDGSAVKEIYSVFKPANMAVEHPDATSKKVIATQGWGIPLYQKDNLDKSQLIFYFSGHQISIPGKALYGKHREKAFEVVGTIQHVVSDFDVLGTVFFEHVWAIFDASNPTREIHLCEANRPKSFFGIKM